MRNDVHLDEVLDVGGVGDAVESERLEKGREALSFFRLQEGRGSASSRRHAGSQLGRKQRTSGCGVASPAQEIPNYREPILCAHKESRVRPRNTDHPEPRPQRFVAAEMLGTWV